MSGPQGTPPRPHRRTRRLGYGLAIVINLALLWAVNVTPGWRWVPLLTEDFSAVVGFVTLSLLAGAAVNLVFVGFDPPWFKRLGDAATGTIATVVLLLLVQVFPFDLPSGWSAWETPLRIVLVLVTIATAISVVANLALALRALVGPDSER